MCKVLAKHMSGQDNQVRFSSFSSFIVQEILISICDLLWCLEEMQKRGYFQYCKLFIGKILFQLICQNPS